MNIEEIYKIKTACEGRITAELNDLIHALKDEHVSIGVYVDVMEIQRISENPQHVPEVTITLEIN